MIQDNFLSNKSIIYEDIIKKQYVMREYFIGSLQ